METGRPEIFDDAKPDPLKVHELGWQWFTMHAEQRMQIVGFWFVAMSFLTTAAVLAYVNARLGASLLVQLCIAASSLVFLLLDLRTRELISYGERLMAAVERSTAAAFGIPELVLVDGPRRAPRLLSYRVLLSVLYGGAAAISLVTAAITVLNM